MARVSILLAGLFLCAQANGLSLQLDQASSDSTPASQMQGSIRFSTSGTTLGVWVHNDTLGTATPFSIYSVHFNLSDDVAGLTYTGASAVGYNQPGAWTPYASGYYVTALRFGTFDYSLWQWTADPIAPGDSLIFEFQIQCKAGRICDDADFGTSTSLVAKGGTPAYAAARWGDGPRGDAAFSAALVPEPASALLLALAAFALRRLRA